MALTVNDILSMIKRGDEIGATDLDQACRDSNVARADLERRVVDAGYFYAIKHDAFMPPAWIAFQKAHP